MVQKKKLAAKKAPLKKARLGRGLEALLGGAANLPDANAAEAKNVQLGDGQNTGDQFRNLPVEWLQRGVYQPRSNMDADALEDLAASIKSQGIVQPILVRELGLQKYEIIAGERRWRAAQIAELNEVPVIIRKIEDETAIAVALIENIQREDLSALEEARGIARLLEEFGLTHQQAASSIGRSRTAVTNLLRLLSLQPAVQDMLEQKLFDMGHARTLLGVPEHEQFRAAKAIVQGKMSVRQAEQWVKRFLEQGDAEQQKTKQQKNKPDADILRLEESLADAIGAKIKIQDSGGKGKILIQYHSLSELGGIIEKFKV